MNLSRQVTKQLAGALMAPLDAAELKEIEAWLCDQLRAMAPERKSWELLWHDKDLFFRPDLERLINGSVVGSIRCGAESVDDPRSLEQWPQISSSLQFILSYTDREQLEIYEAPAPILVGLNNEVWRIASRVGQDGKPTTELSELCPGGAIDDILAVLLWSWEKGRPKASQARERLCDLTGRCVSDRRFGRTSSP
ncbi:MAG: hypothetical protein PHC70_00415 [Patescibacteria group bacterium]|nr:hypothetical protein [Patescibacteria group bacterium]